jgi:hypothetical protein
LIGVQDPIDQIIRRLERIEFAESWFADSCFSQRRVISGKILLKLSDQTLARAKHVAAQRMSNTSGSPFLLLEIASPARWSVNLRQPWPEGVVIRRRVPIVQPTCAEIIGPLTSIRIASRDARLVRTIVELERQLESPQRCAQAKRSRRAAYAQREQKPSALRPRW